MSFVDDEPTSDAAEQQDAVREGLLSYESTHCKHGVFTGHWAGPDYMCFWCEMGVSDAEYEEAMVAREAERKRRAQGLKGLRLLQRMSRRYAIAPTPTLQMRIVRLASHLMGL